MNLPLISPTFSLLMIRLSSDDDCEQIMNLRGILIWFEAVSGLSQSVKEFDLSSGASGQYSIACRDSRMFYWFFSIILSWSPSWCKI